MSVSRIIVVLALGVSACGGTAQVVRSDAGGPETTEVDSGRARTCAVDADCDDGLYCNGAERCAPGDRDADGHGCIAGSAPCLPDDLDCTIEADPLCDEAGRGCTSPTLDHTSCGSGEHCNPTEGCMPGTACAEDGACPDDGNDCTLEVCDDDAGPIPLCAVMQADSGSPCMDSDRGGTCLGDACCSGCGRDGECAIGTDAAACGSGGLACANCDDGIACTRDSCDAATRSCVHRPSDPTCDDGNLCNGAETCAPGIGCVTGPPPTCEDGDPCTIGTCDDAANVCVQLLRDDDGDGFADARCGGSDCDDGDPMVNPVGVEGCNGIDDDCDGMTDERLGTATCGIGACRRTVENCLGGAPQMCVPNVPTAETCNGVDDDCDAACDNGFACCQGSTGLPCMTACGTPGTGTCNGACSAVVACAGVEQCNGCDDDGDGETDDGFRCSRGAPRDCMTACGTPGTQTCRPDCSGFGSCSGAEICNACDDDLDGTPDNGFECVRGATASCMTACGSMGSSACGATCIWGSCVPPMEACGNGVDDDCDGIVDPPCAPGTTCLGGRCLRNPPCTLATYGGHTYAFCTTRSTWLDARDDCAAYGWYLTVVSSAGENDFLFARISGEIWMGFNDRAAEGRWIWDNGEAIRYTNWCPREPNDNGGEDCGSLVQSAGYCGACYCWNDLPCSWTRGYVCEWGS